MTPAQSAALARVAKLVPNLGRDNDNEVLATARAIVRTLAGGGLDLHELAALVAAPSERRQDPAPRPSRPASASTWPDFAKAAAGRTSRSDPMFAERTQAAAFSDFIPWGLSDAVRKEIAPRRDELGPDDLALFDLVSRRLAEGQLLVPKVHSMLLDIAAKLRAKS